MDALKVAKIRKRMCQSYPTCEGCPFAELIECSLECTLGVQNATPEDDKKTIAFVEKWAAEHPLNTRQEEAKWLDICPQCMDIDFKCDPSGDCVKCVCDYWVIER